MRLLLPACFIILLFSITATAQTDSITEQINEQVWKPFINTFNNMYTEGFMALHSKKLLRIPEDNNRIYNYDEYVQNIKTSNENGKKNKIRQSIELRFTNRFIQNEQAFETGYYKTTVVEPDGLKRNSYGKFHVLLQKERDVWKILLDTDAADNVDEATFQKGKPIK